MNTRLQPYLLAALSWVICLTSTSVFAQEGAVFKGNLSLTTQEDIDAFDYREVTGDLFIGNSPGAVCAFPINDLTPLAELTKVGGTLQISGTQHLASLKGLDGLARIGKDLFINNNSGLTSLAGLDALCSASGQVVIDGNPQLRSLKGIGRLHTIGSDLVISNNKHLTSLEGIDSTLNVGSNINISFNPNLADCCLISLFKNNVTGTITISDNAPACSSLEAIAKSCDEPVAETDCSQEDIVLISQTEVDAFECATVTNLTIDFNGDTDPITNLDRLSTLTKVNGNLDIDFLFNSEGVDLSGLNNLKRVEGDLSFYGTRPDFDGLQGLEFVGGDFYFSGLGVQPVDDFTALSNLRYVEGRIAFSSSNISGFRGLSQLTSVGGFFVDESFVTSFEGLTSLVLIRGDLETSQDISDIYSFEGLENVERITGNLRVSAQTINFKGLSGLKSIDGNLIVEESSVDLGGLESLQAVGGNIILGRSDAPSIRNLEALSNLQTVGGNFAIQRTFAENLSVLASLQSVGGYLEVVGNPNLSDCCIIPSLKDVVKGAIVVSDNAPECNSLEAIAENCEEGTATEENARTAQEMHAFPNPSENFVQVSVDQPTFVQLFNTTGYLVKEQRIDEEGTIDLTTVSPGVYLLKAPGRKVQRIIKK